LTLSLFFVNLSLASLKGKEGGGMRISIRETVQQMVAMHLGVQSSTITDATDISVIDPTKLRTELLLGLEFCHGDKNGDPQTFGELIQQLDEVQRLLQGPRVTIRI
jgi:hypothetical protein